MASIELDDEQMEAAERDAKLNFELNLSSWNARQTQSHSSNHC